jgi:hypothetical protein
MSGYGCTWDENVLHCTQFGALRLKVDVSLDGTDIKSED